MAHVVVYLQRTARGLHPGSLAALCTARDLADERGASVLSVCLGDAGAFDDRIIVEASRAGADQLVFLGPEGIQKLFRRLSPRHVFAPYTREAGSVLAQAGIGPMVGRWVAGPPENPHKLEPVFGAVAGTLPWQQAPLQIEPEYEADVTQVELPDWLQAAAEQATDLTTTAEQPPVMYVGDGAIDSETEAALRALGAYPFESELSEIGKLNAATILWFDSSSEGLPMDLVDRNPAVRLILLVGEREVSGPIDSSWGLADYVLAGAPAEIVRQFNGQAWKTVFA